MFNPTFWAVTQPLGLNNPIAGLVHILPTAGLYLTQHFLECTHRGRQEDASTLNTFWNCSTVKELNITVKRIWNDIPAEKIKQKKKKNITENSNVSTTNTITNNQLLTIKTIMVFYSVFWDIFHYDLLVLTIHQ